VTLPRSSSRLQYTIAIVWLVFMVSLASWWLRLGLTSPAWHRMYLWEGGTFLTLLIAGGIAILYGIRREHRRRRALETFFMSFTHDLKTALASIQLQAEGIREDWPDGAPAAPLDRLLHDTLRLQIQLENSLYVAQPDGRLLRESIDVGAAIARLAQEWPSLALRITGSAQILADARAIDTIFRNLLQNAALHGHATEVAIRIESPSSGLVRVVMTDNGSGVSAERFVHLGQPFARLSETSGSGVGLFVCRQIVKRLGGALSFIAPDGSTRGLTVSIELPGER
jgi:signal transduction histidine kinase